MKRRTILKRLSLLIGFVVVTFSARAQFNMNPTLKIGDPAPPLKVAGWVRGNGLSGFEKGKVYVVDFWATWCGGCIASFPHISFIADKYKDKVKFISVDSYEDEIIKKGGDIAKTVAEFLKTPQGQRLSLDVCIDGNENTMYENWVKPLRRQGFPTTFIIDGEGKIAWVDVNLDHLDWVLGQVVTKKWDKAKAADVMQQRDAIEDRFFKAFQEKDAEIKKKQYQEILTASENLEKQYPDRKDAVSFYKLMALNELDKERVPAQLEEMATNPLSRNINMSDGVGLTLRRTDLSKVDYAAIAKVQERLLLNEHNGTGFGGKTVSSYQGLAKTYSLLGDFKKAIDNQQKAIELAKQEKTPADQIKKLMADLESYKKS